MTLTVHDLVARDAIETALANHSRGVDRADLNLLQSAYHPDATVDYGFFQGPAETLVGIIAQAQKGALPSLHRTANMWIKVKGDEAVSESYVMAYVEEPELQRMVFGRYLDRHACRDGVWRLTHRTYVLDGNTNRLNTAMRSDPPVSNLQFAPTGGKGSSDPGRTLLAFAQNSFPGAKPMTAQPDAAAIDAALSKLAIKDLCFAYARGADRGDEALMASVFHEDSMVITGVCNANGAEFAKQIVASVTANLDYCFHSVANMWIEVNGDHGVGEHYVVAQVTAGGNDMMTGGRYVDSYERRDGVWKIKTRTFVCDWTTSHPSTNQRDAFYAALVNRGCWGKSDPVYDLWASL